MFKKALSLLLALMLIVASVSVTAISVSAADGDEEPDTSTWYVVGNNADLLGKAWAADEALTGSATSMARTSLSRSTRPAM